MQPGTRVTWKAGGNYGNSGIVVELAKEHVGSSLATPPEGFVWVCWDTVNRVSLVQIKNLEVRNVRMV